MHRALDLPAWVRVDLQEGRLNKRMKIVTKWDFDLIFFFLSGEDGEARWTMRDLILVLKFPSSYVTS